MRLKFFGAILLAGTISLFSCDPAAKYSKELDEIDSCLLVLDTIEQRYYEIDFNGLDTLVQHILHNESQVKIYYVSDTVHQQLAKNLNRCKGVRKFFTDVKGQQIRYHDEIEAMKTQFANLKSDIENGVLKEDQIKKYLDTERSDLNILNRSFTEFYEKQIKAFEIKEYSVPLVDGFIEEMRAANDSISG